MRWPSYLIAGLLTLLAIVTALTRSAVAQDAASPDASSSSAPKAEPTATQKAQIARLKKLDEELKEAYRTQQYEQGITLAREGANLCLQLVGEEREETAYFLNQLGHFQSQVGDHAGSLQTHSRALAIRRKVHGHMHQHVALSLGHVGGELNRLRRYAEALPNFEEALAIYRKVLGPNQLPTTEIQGHRAFTLGKLDRYDEAKREAVAQIEILTKLLGPDDGSTILAIHNYAYLLRDSGDLRGALRQYESIADGQIKALGPKHYTTLDTLAAIGPLRAKLGDYPAARAASQRYLKHCEEHFGNKNIETALAIGEFMRISAEMGDEQAVDDGFARLRQMNVSEMQDIRIADVWHDAGYCWLQQWAIVEAVTCFENAIKTHQLNNSELKELGAADSMQELAKIFTLLERYDQAREICEKLLTHYESTRRANTLSAAELRATFAHVLGEQGETETAIQQGHAALTALRAARGDLHPEVRALCSRLAVWYSQTENWQQAFEMMHASNRVAHGCLTNLLPGLADREQQQFAHRLNQPEMSVAISLAMHRQRDPAVRALSATWVINAKGLAEEALAQRSRLAHADASQSSTAQKLIEVRARIAKLRLSETGDDTTFTLHEFEQLEEQLSKKLAAAGGHPPAGQTWIDIDRIQASLGKERVLVTVLRYSELRFPYTTFSRSWRPDRYAAWIIPPAGQQIEMLDLGDAATIDEQVALVNSATNILTRQQESLTKVQLRSTIDAHARALAALSVRIMVPIAEKIPDAKELLISPDSTLWLLPWSALSLQEGDFAIEKYRVRMLISGRELVTTPERHPAGRSLIVADPDFDLDPDKGDELTAAVLSSGKLPNEKLPPASTAPLEEVRLAERLPASALEAELVAPSLAKYAGKPPAKLVGANALEGLVKAVHSPKVILLSTHGFVFPDVSQQAASENSGAPRRPAVPVSPMLRCGLVFSGCNQRARAKGEDGILTGLEIQSIDLRGTELVVLSACDTAVGDIRAYDGVSSLRQAFQLAGARAVVATLWAVDEQTAMRQTIDLFDFLAAGQEPAKALQSTQIAAIERLRKERVYPSPIYWAAFTLTGTSAKPVATGATAAAVGN